MAMGKGVGYNRHIMGGFKPMTGAPNAAPWTLPLIKKAPYVYGQYKGI